MVALRVPGAAGLTLWLPLARLALYGALALLWVALVALLVPTWPAWRPWLRVAAYGTTLASGPAVLFLLLVLPQTWRWGAPL